MKRLDRAMILALILCLLLTAVMIPALTLAKSPGYYRRAFARTGLYERIGEDGVTYRAAIWFVGGEEDRVALLSDAQLDAIALHITAYLRGDTDDFTLVLDGVHLNGEYQDGVSLFGEAAILHMKDVRALVRAADITAAVLACLLPFLIFYIAIRRREIGGGLLRGILCFYGVLLAAVVVFILVSALLDRGELGLARALWRNLHYLFFPFRPEKVNASFFNDALTYILRVDLFMGAVYTVLGILAGALALLVGAAVWLKRYEKTQ